MIELRYNELAIDLPASADDLSAEQGFLFRRMEQEFRAFGEPDQLDYIQHIRTMCEGFLGDVSKLPFGKPETIFSDGIPASIFTKVVGGEDYIPTVCDLYSHLLYCLNTGVSGGFYLPYTFEGKQYTIAGIEGLLKREGAKMTLQEVVESLVLQREFSDTLNKSKEEVWDISQTAAIDFTLTKAQICMLLKRVGEELPTKQEDIKQFVRERSPIIERMPLSIYNEVMFFFQNFLTVYTVMKMRENIEVK